MKALENAEESEESEVDSESDEASSSDSDSSEDSRQQSSSIRGKRRSKAEETTIGRLGFLFDVHCQLSHLGYFWGSY